MEKHYLQSNAVNSHINGIMDDLLADGYINICNDSALVELAKQFMAYPVTFNEDGKLIKGLMFFIFYDINSCEVLDFKNAIEYKKWNLTEDFDNWFWIDNSGIVFNFIEGNNFFAIRSRLHSYLKHFFDEGLQDDTITITDEEKQALVKIKLTENKTDKHSLMLNYCEKFNCKLNYLDVLLKHLEPKDFIKAVKA